MSQQTTNHLMMIRPANFHLNEETAENNYYMHAIEEMSAEEIQDKALAEFDGFVTKLRAVGITVNVFQDASEDHTPDSIFPNNWVSFHADGRVIYYPMYAESRREERKQHLIDALAEGYMVRSISKDLLAEEEQGKFLEGTGSLILDREHKIAYAAISERTDPDLLKQFAKLLNYQVVSFGAFQTVGDQRLPIYHTNVMMCVGESFAVICADSIDDKQERTEVLEELKKSGKEVVLISEAQTEQFAGNMLQVSNDKNEKFVVMSASAFNSLEDDQRKILSRHGQLLYSDITTIETLGGGSVRCMMAEVFLPKK